MIYLQILTNKNLKFMKKIMLFVVVLLMCTSIFSQIKTTQEEYNYVTKGLKAQYANGMDMKKGYSLSLYEKIPYNNNITVSYYLLKREETKNTAAIVMVFGKDIDSQNATLYCIPAYATDSNIWEQFNLSILTKDATGTTTYMLLKTSCYALSKALTSDQMTTKK